jgi:hypothetical protein
MWKRWLAMAATCTLAAGCHLVDNAVHNITYETKLKTAEIREKCDYAKMAKASWESVRMSNPKLCCHKEYEQGFKEAFVDYLEFGGSGQPPYLPPKRFWGASYSTPQGHQAIEDWYAGFRHGASEAQNSGYRQWVTLPSAHTTEPPVVLAAPVNRNPETIAPAENQGPASAPSLPKPRPVPAGEPEQPRDTIRPPTTQKMLPPVPEQPRDIIRPPAFEKTLPPVSEKGAPPVSFVSPVAAPLPETSAPRASEPEGPPAHALPAPMPRTSAPTVSNPAPPPADFAVEALPASVSAPLPKTAAPVSEPDAPPTDFVVPALRAPAPVTTPPAAPVSEPEAPAANVVVPALRAPTPPHASRSEPEAPSASFVVPAFRALSPETAAEPAPVAEPEAPAANFLIPAPSADKWGPPASEERAPIAERILPELHQSDKQEQIIIITGGGQDGHPAVAPGKRCVIEEEFPAGASRPATKLGTESVPNTATGSSGGLNPQVLIFVPQPNAPGGTNRLPAPAPAPKP